MHIYPSATRIIACVVLLGSGLALIAEDKPTERVVPLRNAHAHNDYEHKRPLFDALDRGFCSVEADIFLSDDQLLVGHTKSDLKAERTLQKLYLDPLRARIKENGGRVYRDGPSVFLLIDVKTEAKATYTALAKVLADYADILSVTRKGKFEEKAITVVISGNRDQEGIAANEVRYAGIDGRPADLEANSAADLIPWISADWRFQFAAREDGSLSEEQKEKLRAYVAKAHKRGRLVRFWGTPEKPAFWKELRAAGVDLINTDKLEELQRFLLDESKP